MILQSAHVAQLVEHFLGKEEVTDSSSVVGYTPLAQLVEQRIPNPWVGGSTPSGRAH